MTAGTHAAQEAPRGFIQQAQDEDFRNFVRYLASAFARSTCAFDRDADASATPSSAWDEISSDMQARDSAHVHDGICVCAELSDVDPEATKLCLSRVRTAMNDAPVGVLRIRSSGARARGVGAIAQCLEVAGLHPEFVGTHREEIIAILRSARTPPLAQAPSDFRVLAILPAYNEEDVIAQTLTYLIAQGIEVHVIDNWSTDRTVERAQSFLGRGLVALERFPPEAPPATYDLSAILRRVEQIAARSTQANWIVLHDADERRCSPWPELTLPDALWNAELRGFNCIDHVTLNFPPIDDSFAADAADLEDHFRHFEFSSHEGHFHQRRAWRQLGRPILLTTNAGHDVQFEARRVFPYKFLLKHYPIRSRAHGERKVLLERAQRWNAQERSRGWHRQYDGLGPAEFIRPPETLLPFDRATFPGRYLLERLSGVGIFDRPPAWATPPCW